MLTPHGTLDHRSTADFSSRPLILGGPARPECVERAHILAEVILIQDRREVPLARLDIARRCTLTLLEELANLQLVARAYGWSIVLEDTVPELIELIELAGLSDVIPARPRK